MNEPKERYVLRSTILPIGQDFVPILEQASVFGREVPVGKTAKEVREIGFNIDPSVPDDAILNEEPRSPTGFVFAFRGESKLAAWAVEK